MTTPAEEDKPSRAERLREILDEKMSGYNFRDWEDAEGIPEQPQRFAMIDDCGSYAWVQFGPELVYFNDYFSEGFEPVAVYDLDTGEAYSPRLTWQRAKTHAPECDMDEDCSCPVREP